MKLMNFIIFLSVVLLVYGSVNYIIFIRGWQALNATHGIKIYYIIIFTFLSLTYIAGRILERATVCAFSDILIWIGSFWLGAILYLSLSILLLDIFRLLNHWFSIFPDFITQNYEKSKQIAMLSVIIIVCVLSLAGFINARSINIKTLNLNIRKSTNTIKSLNIAIISDIHLGTIIGKNQFEKIVEQINGLQPDIVLFAGDMVDEDIKPVIEENLGESFLKVKSKDGIYAIFGNHEHIGGADSANKYLSDHGISILRDSVVKVFDEIYIIGREDRSSSSFGGKRRKTLEELVTNIDHKCPIILMDHQPFNLEEAVKNKIDLQISGHTHHGQLWPFNFITNMVYELSWGYKKINDTHFYVSSGVGSWGPPMRLGNSPEIVNIIINFE